MTLLELNRFSKHTQRDIAFFKFRTEIPYVNKRAQNRFDFICRGHPETVLEVGCGEGIALQYIKPLRYIGVDLSLARLRFASTRYQGHSFIQGNGSCLPFYSETFDFIFCNGTLHHLSKQGIFLMIRELGRVCKRGGWVAIIEPNVYNPSSFLLGLLRKPERGIFHCKPKAFLRYLEESGVNNEMVLKYDGTFSIISLFTHFFSEKNFVKTSWFNKLWEKIDNILIKVVPERFWTSMVIIAKK